MEESGEQETGLLSSQSSSDMSNEDIDDEELKRMLKEETYKTDERKQNKDKPGGHERRSYAYDWTKLGLEHHGNILKIEKASVLALTNTEFISAEKKRRNTNEYSSIINFIDTFGYEDALEIIFRNIIMLNKMNFQNITVDHARKVGFNVSRAKVNHLEKMQKKYERLRDNIGINTELMTAIDNGKIVEILDKLSWSKEQIELIVDIAAENESRVDALMVFVCSHGQTNDHGQMEIMDVFGKPIKVDAIIAKLSKCEISCRMLFINACRGDKEQRKEAVLIQAAASQPKTAAEGQTDTGGQNPSHEIETEHSKRVKRQSIIVQETETSTRRVQKEDRELSQRMEGARIENKEVLREREKGSIEDANQPRSKSLPEPTLVNTKATEMENRPKTDTESFPICLESCGDCPNDCLVLYSTTRGFRSDRRQNEETPFTSYFDTRLGELNEKCPNGIAFIPFLQMLTGELAQEDVMGDLHMLTFDHSLCQMPVLVSHQSDSK